MTKKSWLHSTNRQSKKYSESASSINNILQHTNTLKHPSSPGNFACLCNCARVRANICDHIVFGLVVKSSQPQRSFATLWEWQCRCEANSIHPKNEDPTKYSTDPHEILSTAELLFERHLSQFFVPCCGASAKHSYFHYSTSMGSNMHTHVSSCICIGKGVDAGSKHWHGHRCKQTAPQTYTQFLARGDPRLTAEAMAARCEPDSLAALRCGS